jgi:hypothetical protein
MASAAFLLLLAGCGTLTGPRSGTVSPPVDALGQWADYPANQVPRPIVLLGIDSQGQAFDTNDEKIAALCAKFTLSVFVPMEVPKQGVATWADGTSVTYPSTSASDAFAAVMEPGKRASSPDCAKVAPLNVTASRLGVSRFTTDRGIAQMSAWLFKATGAAAEFGYPAIAPSAFWKGGLVVGSIGGGAIVSTGGRTLTYSFPGGPPDGPCAEDYSGVIAESPTAVAVAVQSNPGRPEGGAVTCDLVGHIRAVTVQLASPLDGRVLVDASGYAVSVCPEAIRTGC